MSTAQGPAPMAPPPHEREINCPRCGELTRFGPSNPHRPFCSARCQQHDFGAWASEHYRMGAPPTEGERDGDEPQAVSGA